MKLLVLLLVVHLLKDGASELLIPLDRITKPGPSKAPMGEYTSAAVACNSGPCAKIGRDILAENGTAADAAIAVLICEGVISPHSLGIGGGFFLNIFKQSSGTAEILNAKEKAPAAAYEGMFLGNTNSSKIGGLAIGVPGILGGIDALYKKYGGGVPWARLFQPSVKLCREGYAVERYLAHNAKVFEKDIRAFPNLRDYMVNPKNNELYKEGDMIKNPRLGDTLELISREGVKAFYNGSLTKTLVKEIHDAGGLLTRADFAEYQPEWQLPVSGRFKKHTFFTPSMPSSSAMLVFILQVLDDLDLQPDDSLTYHRIIEAWKYAYAKRTELGDIRMDSFVPDAKLVRQVVRNLTSKVYADKVRQLINDNRTYDDPKHYGGVYYIPDDHGTAHISVLAPNGDAVGVTSSINSYFGSFVRSKTAGFIFNNHMDDFSIPGVINVYDVHPSPTNFVKPGKRPLSSMSPTIFINKKGKVRLVLGSEGGASIPTSISSVIVNHLVYNMTIKQAVDEPRIHHQLMPNVVAYEYGFLGQIVKSLKKYGHVTRRDKLDFVRSAVTGIAKSHGRITATYDYRRGGSVDGF